MDLHVRIDDENVRRWLKRARHLVEPLTTQLTDTYLRRASDGILTKAARMAPVDRDALQRSGRVDVMKTGAKRVMARLSYGGMASKYARYQHEGDELTHSEADWNAKYGADNIIVGFGRKGHLVPRAQALTMLAKAEGKGKPTWASHDAQGNLLGHRSPDAQAHWLYGRPYSAVESGMADFRRQVATGVTKIVRGWMSV